MKKIILIAFVNLSVLAFGQVSLIPKEGVEISNAEDITNTLSNALADFESELSIVVKDKIVLRSVISETGKKIIKITVVEGEFDDNILWSKKQLWNLNMPESWAGAQLDWVFNFGLRKPKAYMFDEVEEFPKVKVEEGLKTNRKFDKAIYRYSVDRELDDITELFNYTENNGSEGLIDIDMYINEVGKVDYVQTNLLTDNVRTLKYVVDALYNSDFGKGAQINSQSVTFIYNRTFELIDKNIGNKERYINGLKYFRNKDYLSAAFQWIQIDEEVFKLDSTRYYQVAVSCFLSGFKQYKEKAEEYYKKAHQLDWEQFFIKEVSVSNDSNMLVDFTIAMRED